MESLTQIRKRDVIRRALYSYRSLLQYGIYTIKSMKKERILHISCAEEKIFRSRLVFGPLTSPKKTNN